MTTAQQNQTEGTKTYGLMALVKGTTPMVEKGPDNSVMSWPRLLMVEFLLALGTTLVLTVFSAFANAPLKDIADPNVTENPAKAAWYFVGLQEMLLHMSPLLAGVIIPGLLILTLLALPYFDRSRRDQGIWFASPKGRRIAWFAVVYTAVWVLALVLFDGFLPIRSLISSPEFVPAWIIPIGVLVGLVTLLYFFIKRFKASRRELMVGIFTAFLTTYFLLTLIAIFFRGYGMALTWPWDLPKGALPF
jgi:menaquinol-cytochrome c reductase cytochrome b/c subunit